MTKEYVEPPNNCIVCGMELAGRTGVVTHDLEGELYTLCSPECFKKFEESPESYIEADEDEE
jgi:YHS domain-containing protein